MKADEFWRQFLEAAGLDCDTVCSEVFHFEITEYWADRLLELVISGQKRATSSSLIGYELEGDKVPEAGEYSIVTNWAGEPKCVIRTTAVTIIPFCDITYDICCREGEDDNLESWQNSHRSFFTEEGEQLGYQFTEDMPVIFEDFEVVYTADGGLVKK